MEISFDFFTIIISLGILQIYFFWFIFFSKKEGNRKSNLLLASLMFIIASCLSSSVLILTGIYKLFPHLVRSELLMLFIIPVLLYLYTKSLIYKVFKFTKKDLINFLPVVIVFIILMPFFVNSSEVKIEYADRILSGEYYSLDIVLIISLNLLSCFYIFKIFKLLKYRKDNDFRKNQLSWIKMYLFSSSLIIFTAVVLIVLILIFGFPYILFYKYLPVFVSVSVFYLGYKVIFRKENSPNNSLETVKHRTSHSPQFNFQDTDKKITIGLLIDNLYDHYGSRILKGVMDLAEESGINIICFNGGNKNNTSYNFYQKAGVYDLVNSSKIKGVILMSLLAGFRKEDILEIVKRFSNFPVVICGIRINGLDSVYIDTEKGLKDLFIHLIGKHGRSKIAFIAGPEDDYESNAKLNIYKKVLKETNLKYNEELVVYGNIDIESGSEAVKILLDKRNAEFDAVFAVNDLIAIYAMKELTDRGIQVPEDIAVAGFDNNMESRYLYKSLTTVAQPITRIGYESARMLLNKLNKKNSINELMLPSELIIRQSCGCSVSREYQMNRIHINNNEDIPVINKKEQTIKMDIINQGLLTVSNIENFREVLFKELPKIGIYSCFISLYHTGDNKFAELIFAFKDNEAVSMEESDNIFPSVNLVPEFIQLNKNYVVMSLYYKDEKLGYIIYESDYKTALIYELITKSISSAIKIIQLNKELLNKTFQESNINHSNEDNIENEEFYKKLLNLMEKDKVYLNPDIMLPDLAELLRITPNQLSVLINKFTGLRYYDFINIYRVEEAKKYLEGTDFKNILDIAFVVGFKSKSTFNKLFKKYLKETPSQYKKRSIRK